MLFLLLGSRIISPQPSSDTVFISLVMVIFKIGAYIIHLFIYLVAWGFSCSRQALS